MNRPLPPPTHTKTKKKKKDQRKIYRENKAQKKTEIDEDLGEEIERGSETDMDKGNFPGTENRPTWASLLLTSGNKQDED